MYGICFSSYRHEQPCFERFRHHGRDDGAGNAQYGYEGERQVDMQGFAREGEFVELACNIDHICLEQTFAFAQERIER